MTDQTSTAGLDPHTEQQVREALARSYEVQDVIGVGASAVVFRAVDAKHGRPVALKVLRPEIAARIEGRRFLQEIDVASRLSHPHVLALHDSGDIEGILYYVMPLVDGVSLRTRLRQEGPLRLDDALRITRDVASGLQHAHDHGVVHRDVKPENILLTSDGSATLADFGLAHMVLDMPAVRLTGGGLAVGTAWYMSPEQGSADTVDTRADQYALACVLYEMLVGDPPFQGRTVQNVIAHHRFDPRPHVRAVRESVPEGIDAAIVRGMAIHAADRFATVTDFARGLEAALTAETLAAVRATRKRSGERRPRFLAGVSWAVAALIVIASVVLAIRMRVHRRPMGALDSNRIAVAPFSMLGVSDTLWSVGMVDLLLRNFDGAGPLRSVPASVVLRAWSGRADEPSATRLASRTGAGLVVFGSVEVSGRDRSSGRDSVRLRATLFDAVAGRPMGLEYTTSRDDVSRIPILADTLAGLILGELSRTRAITAVVGRSLGSTSLAALKAFLQAEQALRRNDYTEAGRWYGEAVALDDKFAVAYRGLRTVRRVLGDENDSLARWYGLRAGERNHGLTPRDSLLIVGDSLAGGAPLGFTFYTVADFARLQRRLSTLGILVDRYPNDPDAWHELGEARVHPGYRAGIDQQTALEAFEEAVRADSGYAPAYWHAIELALSYRSRDSVRALVRRYRHLRPDDGRIRALGLLLAPSRSDNAEAWRQVGRLSADTAASLGHTLRRWRAAPAIGLRVLHDLLDDRARFADIERIQISSMLTLLQYGRLDESREYMVQRGFDLVPMNLVSYGRYGLVRADSVTEVMRAWATTTSTERVLSAVQWFGYRRDTTALKQLASRFMRSVPSHSSVNDSVAFRYLRGAIRAHLSLARSDTAEATVQFASLPDSLCSWGCWIDVEITAQLLVAHGDVTLAARLLDRHPPPNAPLAFIELPWLAARTRVARLLNDSAVIVRLSESLAALSRDTDGLVATALRLGPRKP